MARPRRQRDNPKARRIRPPPEGVDLATLAPRCRYVGSPHHKDTVSFAGQPRPRPDASICPRRLANRRSLVENWLQTAVAKGHVGAWEGDFPRYAWYRDPGDGAIYEARLTESGSGGYKGYPLTSGQRVRGLP